MIKRKRKRNPLKEDKDLLLKIICLLSRAMKKRPDGIYSYLLAEELIRRDTLYCEECHTFDIEKICDWSICYPEIYELADELSLDLAKEKAKKLLKDLEIWIPLRDYNMDLI